MEITRKNLKLVFLIHFVLLMFAGITWGNQVRDIYPDSLSTSHPTFVRAPCLSTSCSSSASWWASPGLTRWSPPWWHSLSMFSPLVTTSSGSAILETRSPPSTGPDGTCLAPSWPSSIWLRGFRQVFYFTRILSKCQINPKTVPKFSFKIKTFNEYIPHNKFCGRFVRFQLRLSLADNRKGGNIKMMNITFLNPTMNVRRRSLCVCLNVCRALAFS